VDRDEVHPIYIDEPYYIYPDGEPKAETFRVIGQAMAHRNKVGLGRVTISGRAARSSSNSRRRSGDVDPCALPTKSARPSSAPRRRVKPTLKWLPSPRRSLSADRVRSSRRASETAIRTRCES
jgi:hypothetical protein